MGINGRTDRGKVELGPTDVFEEVQAIVLDYLGPTYLEGRKKKERKRGIEKEIGINTSKCIAEIPGFFVKFFTSSTYFDPNASSKCYR